jgi:glycosyltransferase 2 family protein
LNRKQALSLVLRIGLSALMLAVLIWRIPPIDVDEVLPPLDARTIGWLSIAMALTLVGLLLSAVRWQQVLEVLGLHAGLRRLVSLCLAGQFVSNVLPTTIGGDVLRVSRLSRETGHGPTTFASVVLERLSGWIVLPILTFTGLLLNPGLRELGRASTIAAGVGLVTLVALIGVLALVGDRRVLGRFASSEGWQRFAGAVHLGITTLREHPKSAMAVLGVGIGYQLVLVVAALCAAQALHISGVGITSLLVFMPAVLILQVLPIGISGLGIREAAFVLFLQPLGVPPEQAIALGLLLYLLNLVTSLPGAGAFAVGGRAPRPEEPRPQVAA